MFVAVVKYIKENQTYNVYVISDEYRVVNGAAMTERELVNLVQSGNTPVNFGVDRTGHITAECGDFSRFSSKGSGVILAELRTKGGKTLGYRVLSCLSGQIVNLKVKDIVERDNAYGDEHFIQNGIIRNGVVNCYPRHPYPEINMMKEDKHKKISKSAVLPTASNEYPIQNENGKKALRSESDNSKDIDKRKQYFGGMTRKQAEKFVSNPANYKQEQNKELARCKKAGIDPLLIGDPDLDPKQMRVLWVAASNGAKAEYFNSPKISTDSMKFYADRIFSDDMASDCAAMLAHPELSVDELDELYMCLCDGMDYTGLIGSSPSDIDVARLKQNTEYWGSSSEFDVDYYQKALNVAMKMAHR